MLSIRITLGFVLVVLATSCSRNERSWIVPPPDPWLRWFRGEQDVALEKVPAQRLRVVGASHEPAALALLERESVRVLTAAEERQLLDGRVLEHRDAEQVILVRGLVAMDDGEGLAKDDELEVWWHPDAVVVSHAAYGTRYVPTQRRALVVVVPSVPREAYVESTQVIVGGLKAR